MRSITFVQAIGLAKLSGTEYLNLMVRLKKLIEKATISEVGLTEAEFEEFTDYVNALQQRVNHNMSSALTDSLSQCNKNRNAVLSVLFFNVKNGIELPIPEQAKAAKELDQLISPYYKITNIPDQQKTIKINGLLLDLSGEAAQANLTTMNLLVLTQKLEALNEEFSELTDERTKEVELYTPETIIELRKCIDPLYSAITAIAQSKNIIEPTDKSKEFITLLNATIKEINKLYNIRTGHQKKEDQETTIPGSDTDKPSTEEPSEPETPQPGVDNDGDGSPEVV